MQVKIPSPLFSYTGQRAVVNVEVGARATLGAVLDDLERQFKGIRFRVIDEQDRVRPHIKMFVSGKLAGTLAHAVTQDDEVMIVAALSGG